jgi:hypothetical protein
MSEVSWETFLTYPDGDEMAGVRISEPSRMRASRSVPRRFVHLLNHCGSQVTTRMGSRTSPPRSNLTQTLDAPHPGVRGSGLKRLKWESRRRSSAGRALHS